MCLRWLEQTSPLPCSLQSIRIVTLTPSQIRDALVRQFTRLFYSVLQQGHSFGVWEMICKDNQRGPSIHRVWIRVVSHARSEIDPRSLRKSFSGAWEGPVTFLRMSERLRVWLSQSRRPCLFQSRPEKKQNETKPNETKTQTDLAELKPQIATETRELLVCVCFPVRCCREIHPPHVAAKYVNSNNVDGQRNHWQGPHKIVG